MRALTLYQPHASLVALGVKTIETRSWSTPYRGPLAVHASKRTPDQSDLRLWMPLHSAMKRQLPCGKCGHADGWHVCHMTYTRCAFCGCDGWTEPPVPLGAVVATCTLVDVVPITDPGLEPRYRDVKHLIASLPMFGLRICRPSTHSAHGWDLEHCEDQRTYGDFSPGRFAWLLADIVPLAEPVPAKGRQGLWEWAAAPNATAV